MASLTDRLTYLFAQSVIAVANLLQDGLADWLGARFGDIAWLVLSSRRKIALDNLRHAFQSEKSEQEIRRICRRVFQNIGRVCFEIARNQRFTPERLKAIVSSEQIDQVRNTLALAQGEGKGVIAMTAHFGNWELAGGWVAAQGYPVDFLAGTMKNKLVDRLFTQQRSRLGIPVLHLWDNPKLLLKQLRAKRFCGMLADQHSPESDIIIPFFGRPVSVARGAALMAVRTGCPIVVMLLRRVRYDRFEFIAGPLIRPAKSGNDEADMVLISQQYTQFVEDTIRRFPDQWLWTHRRWKLPPDTPYHPLMKPLTDIAVQAYVRKPGKKI